MDAGPFRGAAPFAAEGFAFSGGAGLTFSLPGFSALFALAPHAAGPALSAPPWARFWRYDALALHFLTVLGLRISAFGLSAVFGIAPLAGGAAALLHRALMLGGTFVPHGAALFALGLLGARAPLAALALLACASEKAATSAIAETPYFR